MNKHYIVVLLSLFVFALSSLFSLAATYIFSWADYILRSIAIVLFWIAGFAIASRLLWFIVISEKVR